MTYLVDTNVISELRKGPRCHASVTRWFRSVDDRELFISVLVLGEIRKGVERTRQGDAAKARAIESWLDELGASFSDRVLDIDRHVAEDWGRLNAKRTVPVIDGLMAATARVHGKILVTRNLSDVRDLDANIFNPFSA